MSNNLNSMKKVLIVDDDKSVTQMLSMLLETRGYEVTVACSEKEAFEKISTHTDIVILDLVLSNQDGFNICCKMKQNNKTYHIPIIILSAKVCSTDIVEGLYLGADDYLTKPFEFEELVARMEAVMRRGRIFKNGYNNFAEDDENILEIRKIIDEGNVVPFFQPIFYLEPFKLLGFEALCRPKTETILANPEMLFKAAIQYGFYQELEMLSWRKALEYASNYLSSFEKLFLNCNPYLVEGPKFLTIKSLFEENKIDPANVVLEITERSAIKDTKLFYDQLKKYKESGFNFAVDDVGGGYASLESIVETRPEIVKIDRHIIGNLDKDEVKVNIVKFVLSFCKENGILSIAEGIERKEELELVIKLGVDAGQGFYLSRPNAQIDIKKINEEIVACH